MHNTSNFSKTDDPKISSWQDYHSDEYYTNPGWQKLLLELKVNLERISKIWEGGLEGGLTREVMKSGEECLLKYIDDLTIDFIFVFQYINDTISGIWLIR